MTTCEACFRGTPVMNLKDLRHPHTECPDCGAVVALPSQRYRIDWNTAGSEGDGLPWYDFQINREQSIILAKAYLLVELDRAVITDRWGIEDPIVFVKRESVKV